MFYTILDSKEECLGYYYDGGIHEQKPDTSKHYITWDYKHHHHQDGAQYLNLYCGGKPISAFCPPHLQREWEISQEKKKAFGNAISSSKVKIDDVCIYDLIPLWFLRENSQLRCEILQEIHSTRDRPKSYDFMLELEKLFGEISQNQLSVDISALRDKRGQTAVRNFIKRIKGKTTIKYNQFGTVTGRLTVSSDSFPIMNVNHSFRNILKPNNDLFVEFDYNAAELRTLLALSEREQPQEDIHEWNIKNVFKRHMTREEAKKKIFAAIYNPNTKQDYYQIDKVLEKHYAQGQVTTPFGREIDCDDGHALNYTLQSTTSDLVLEQTIKINKLLEGKKSKIVFLIHDSFVVDLAQEERSLIFEIKEIFSQNRFGDFLVNVSAGRDFGSMKEIAI